MKKRIIALFVLLLFCLSSCLGNNSNNDDIAGDAANSNLVVISRIDKGVLFRTRKETQNYVGIGRFKGFEVNIGIGRYSDYYRGLGPYSSVTFTINAPGYTIVLPDGSRVDEKYSVVYSDFDDEKYKVRLGKDGYDKYDEMNYETFRFIYNGEEWFDDGYIKSIEFSLSYIDEESDSGRISDSTTTHIYYKMLGLFYELRC
jgi:hypothetical protein